MTDRNYRGLGKWSALCVIAGFFAASGQACPPGMPGPASSLAGLWTGPISGDVTINTLINMPNPPNPNSQATNTTSRIVSTQQIVFDEAGRPTTLPMVLSAFQTNITQQAITAFNVGETQTITTSETQTVPSGATFTATQEVTETTTLTVNESVLSAEHVRVVYATTNILRFVVTFTDPMSEPRFTELSSTGTLTIDAAAAGGLVMFSLDFNNTGSFESMEGMTTTTGNGFVVGSLSGILAAD